MKKIILAVLVCSLSSCELLENKKSVNEKVAIYDNNFERKLIDLKYDDIIDGYVSKDGIKYCRELDLSKLGLFDLKGIEAFDSLRELNVSYNQLTSIDLSKNTGLVKINIEYNQLTSIDLSKNTKLVNLYVSNNQLTSIDLSKNTKLVNLYVYSQNDGLNKLNINGCDSLKVIGTLKNIPELIENDLKNKGFVTYYKGYSNNTYWSRTK